MSAHVRRTHEFENSRQFLMEEIGARIFVWCVLRVTIFIVDNKVINTHVCVQVTVEYSSRANAIDWYLIKRPPTSNSTLCTGWGNSMSKVQGI